MDPRAASELPLAELDLLAALPLDPFVQLDPLAALEPLAALDPIAALGPLATLETLAALEPLAELDPLTALDAPMVLDSQEGMGSLEASHPLIEKLDSNRLLNPLKPPDFPIAVLVPLTVLVLLSRLEDSLEMVPWTALEPAAARK